MHQIMFVWVCFLLSISCFCAGADLRTLRACYGQDYVIPSSYKLHVTRVKVFFKPSYPEGSPKTLVLDKLKLKDPRYRFTFMSLTIPEVTEQDNGIFSIMQDDGSTYDIFRLKITDDCFPKIVLTYGSTFVRPVLSSDSSIVFHPLDSFSEPVVLWNRTNDQVAIEGMGEMNGYSFSIKRVTQKHQGHYTFRNHKDRIVGGTKLEVKEHVESYTMETGERLIVSFGLDSEQCNLDFILDEDSEYLHLIEKGRVSDDRVEILGRRAHFSFAINSLDESDSGKYVLRDQDNNLALVVWLKVKPITSWITYVSVGGIVFLLVSFCCCLRKCCCKRNATKRNGASGSGEVVIHQAETDHMTSQPSGPSHTSPPYFQSYAREPAVTISPAAPYGPVHRYQSTPAPTPPLPYPSSNDTTAPDPQVYNPTGEDPPSFPLGFGCSSSESETQFKLPQRLNFHTALFPSTDLSSSEYVYNSDKLPL